MTPVAGTSSASGSSERKKASGVRRVSIANLPGGKGQVVYKNPRWPSLELEVLRDLGGKHCIPGLLHVLASCTVFRLLLPGSLCAR